MPQESPGRRHASVEDADRSGRLSLSKDDGFDDGFDRSSDGGSDAGNAWEQGRSEPRTYPAAALWAVLVGGILLGLLFAAVISSFVGGSSGSSSSGPESSASRSSGSGSGKTSTPDAIASQQGGDAQSRQRSDSIQAANSPESRDVRILGCGTDAQGFASARVQITNSTSQRATYYVRVLFTTAGKGRIVSDAVASVKRLPPGQVAPLQPVNAVDAAPGEQVDCSLGSVSRF